MVLIVVSVAWIPILQGSNGGQLFIYMQSVTSSLAPPVTAVFLLGIFWPRANEQVGAIGQKLGAACLPQLPLVLGAPALSSSQGAFWGLMAGLAVGATKMLLEFLYPVPPCGNPDTRPAILGSIHYLHFAIALFTLSAAVVAAGSLLTPAPLEGQVSLPLAFPCPHSGPLLASDPLLMTQENSRSRRNSTGVKVFAWYVLIGPGLNPSTAWFFEHLQD